MGIWLKKLQAQGLGGLFRFGNPAEAYTEHPILSDFQPSRPSENDSPHLLFADGHDGRKEGRI